MKNIEILKAKIKEIEDTKNELWFIKLYPLFPLFLLLIFQYFSFINHSHITNSGIKCLFISIKVQWNMLGMKMNIYEVNITYKSYLTFKKWYFVVILFKFCDIKTIFIFH